MRLSKVAILALKGMNGLEKKKLAEDMGVTEDTLYRWIRENHDNFTKAAYLVVLRRELGLSDEDLLDHEEEAVA